MNAPTITYTGYQDKQGTPINIGDTVRCPEGFVGSVKMINGAIRFDIDREGVFLERVSSQLWNDHRRPWEFEVL